MTHRNAASDFEESALKILRSLRPGEAVTYGEVAELAGFPGRARAVGRLLGVSEEDLPWWRVVGYGGRLRSPHPIEQARLLEDEGWMVSQGGLRGFARA